ncbi:MAG: GNAT family N-acetyltransferase [Candidatus Krumholzibacteriota bacterium]
MQNHVFELAGTSDLAAVTSFYETVGYSGGVHPGDRLLVGLLDGRIVAAVRLCEEEGLLVLRGMYVAPDFRSRRLGTELLRFASLEIGPQECWCVPYEHLTGFYAEIGFRVCAGESVPEFLVERQARYAGNGHVVTIMRRRAGLPVTEA